MQEATSVKPLSENWLKVGLGLVSWLGLAFHLGTCESFFFRSNRISNRRTSRPIRFRIEYSNRIGRIPHKP